MRVTLPLPVPSHRQTPDIRQRRLHPPEPLGSRGIPKHPETIPVYSICRDKNKKPLATQVDKGLPSRCAERAQRKAGTSGQADGPGDRLDLSQLPGDGRPLGEGSACVLDAHHNLPPASDATNLDARKTRCDCQAICNEDGLARTHNTLRFRRLATAGDDRLGLGLHASAPVRSGDSILGILNVAGPDWSSFSAEALALMTNVGNQIGVAGAIQSP